MAVLDLSLESQGIQIALSQNSDGTYAVKTAEQRVGALPNPVYRLLDTSGDGTGTKNAVGTYASATDFYIEPPSDKVYRIHRMMTYIEDVGTFDSGSYGNGITLTNGIKVFYKKNGVEYDLLDGLPIKTNVDWRRVAYDAEPSTYGAGNESITARWTFSRAGNPIRLDGATDDRLIVRLEDTFTDLVSQYFFVQGHEEE